MTGSSDGHTSSTIAFTGHSGIIYEKKRCIYLIVFFLGVPSHLIPSGTRPTKYKKIKWLVKAYYLVHVSMHYTLFLLDPFVGMEDRRKLERIKCADVFSLFPVLPFILIKVGRYGSCKLKILRFYNSCYSCFHSS